MRGWGRRAWRASAAVLASLGFVGLSAGYAPDAPAATAAPAAPAATAAAGTVQAAGRSAASGYTLPSDVKRECPPPTSGTYECMALVRTDLAPSKTGPVGGYGPSDLQSAYNLASAAAAKGKGITVALLTVGDNPNAVSDFNAYRAHYGLPACDQATGNGCLTKVNMSGGTDLSAVPAAAASWAAQASMDADTVAAICPQCHVLLAEAPVAEEALASVGGVLSPSGGTAEAKIFVAGFGAPDSSQEASLATPSGYGAVIAAAAGDDGYGTQLPASSQFATAVGGTTLTPASTTARGWTETAWAGTGSGCVTDQYKPAWQSDTGCTGRTQNDVAAVANPQTGVAFYDTDQFGGWGVGGGTNISAAVVAAAYALAGTPARASFPAQFPYRAGTGLYPVTSGSNGTCSPAYLCTAGPGYNGPAGLGTPDGTAAFTAPSGNIVTLYTIYIANLTVGQLTSFAAAMDVFDSAPGQDLSLTATGLPPGLSVYPANCENGDSSVVTVCAERIQGVPTKAGVYHVTVTATDTTGASSSVSFPMKVADVVLPADASESVTLGQTVSAPVSATSESGEPLNFAVSGQIPPGIIWAKTGPDQITFTGKPTVPGRYTTTVTAGNRYGGSAKGHVYWAVHGTITISPLPNITSKVGGPGEFMIKATDSVKGMGLGYSLSGLPPGIRATQPPHSGFYSGWLTKAGTYHVKATVYDDYGATSSVTFTWTVRDTIGGPVGPIRLDLGGKCLDMGTGVRIWHCNGTWAQRWRMAEDGTIRGLGECLTETSRQFGARVVLRPCDGGADQRWAEETTRDDPSHGPALVNVASDRCLGDPGGTRNGIPAETLACNIGRSKTWTTPAGHVESGIPGVCLADPANQTANGTRLVLWKCYNWHEEAFTLHADGTLRIHGRCVYVNPGNTSNGSPVVLEKCSRADKGELWVPYGASPFGTTIYSPWNGDSLGVTSNTAGNGARIGTYWDNQLPRFSWRVR